MRPEASSTPIAAAKPGRYLTFKLGRESYGLPVLGVREIIRLCPITPVPRMPEYIKGVINLRGKVIPILDLRAKFQLSTDLSLIHISEPTRLLSISYAVFCLK